MRRRPTVTERTVTPCAGCARMAGRQCIAFTLPGLMWRKGACWGYTTDEGRVTTELADGVEYAKAKGNYQFHEYRGYLRWYRQERGLEQAGD